MPPIISARDVERFLRYVDQSGGPDACWPWTGGRYRNGYGRFHIGATSIGTHRLAYELWVGSIPDGMCVCHTCPGGDHRWCVNPRHLWIGTKSENSRDLVTKGRAQGSKPNPVIRAELNRPYVGIGLSHPGEKNPYAKLTDADVIEIRQRWQPRVITAKMLAAEYGVATATVKQILLRRTWKHLP